MAINVKDKLVTVEALAEVYNALTTILDRIGASNLNSNPSMLVNLESTSTANVMQASPRPGITGALPISHGGTGATTATQAKTNLGLGTSTQNLRFYGSNTEGQLGVLSWNVDNPNDDRNDSIVSLIPKNNGIGVWSHKDGSTGWMFNLTVPVSVENGGTGANNAAQAKANLGIGNSVQNFGVGQGTTPEQLYYIASNVQNGANQDYDGKRVMLMLRNDGFLMWNSNDGIPMWQLTVPVALTQGGTGATNAADARANLGITPANIGAFGPNSVPAVTDANDTSLFGARFFQASTCANLPSSGTNTYYYVAFMGYLQFAVQITTGSMETVDLYVRYYLNSQWYDWKKIEPAYNRIVLARGVKEFGQLSTDANVHETISFGETLPTNNYMVILDPISSSIVAGSQNKTTTSFELFVRNVSGNTATGTVSWAVIRMP